MAINHSRTHNLKYNMHDVFIIVNPSPDPSKYSFVDLYKDYAQVPEAEVAASMTKDPDNMVPSEPKAYT